MTNTTTSAQILLDRRAPKRIANLGLPLGSNFCFPMPEPLLGQATELDGWGEYMMLQTAIAVSDPSWISIASVDVLEDLDELRTYVLSKDPEAIEFVKRVCLTYTLITYIDTAQFTARHCAQLIRMCRALGWTRSLPERSAELAAHVASLLSHYHAQTLSSGYVIRFNREGAGLLDLITDKIYGIDN